LHEYLIAITPKLLQRAACSCHAALKRAAIQIELGNCLAASGSSLQKTILQIKLKSKVQTKK
jgi:hypothetical protein